METEEYMKKSLAALVLLGVLITYRTEAAAVTLLVIETGLTQEQGSVQQSLVWEDALMDVLFDAGHIVTNTPMMRFQDKTNGEFPEEAESELDEAREWGADFFIIAILNYEGGAQAPREITLRLFRISPYQRIYEQHLTGRNYRTQKEESDSIKAIARGVVPHLNDR
jgi:hypothetical protein